MIRLIIKREYLLRIRKISFIVATLLTPIAIFALMFIPAYLTTQGVEEKKILIVDESNYFANVFQSSNELKFEFQSVDMKNAKKQVKDGIFDALVWIPSINLDTPKGYQMFSNSNLSLNIIRSIERMIDEQVEDLRLEKSGLDKETIESFKVATNLQTIVISKDGIESESNSVSASIIGYAGAFFIYIFIFIYGTRCMLGIIDEKNSHVLEILVTTVKPFHLMMGKIFGIALVVLTQFLIWASFIGILYFVGVSSMENEMITKAMESIESINLFQIIVTFIVCFIGGYLLYGALFASIGAASDTQSDAQQFVLPITVPLLISIMVLGAVLNDPSGSLAFWLSMIPFTSPVIMMMRVPFGIENWELILFTSLLTAGFLLTTWIASKIYRIGILVHGSKVNWRVLIRWALTKG